jgi:hypothetical protein
MPRFTMLPCTLLAIAGCAKAEPVGSAPLDEPPATSTTELGAVALPDAKGCVERCTAQRPEAECRSECAEQCLAHCKTGRPSSADWAATCERDCQTQLDAANTVRSN